jgi:metal-sulfur cluster biosynthetic enzyme
MVLEILVLSVKRLKAIIENTNIDVKIKATTNECKVEEIMQTTRKETSKRMKINKFNANLKI